MYHMTLRKNELSLPLKRMLPDKLYLYDLINCYCFFLLLLCCAVLLLLCCAVICAVLLLLCCSMY